MLLDEAYIHFCDEPPAVGSGASGQGRRRAAHVLEGLRHGGPARRLRARAPRPARAHGRVRPVPCRSPRWRLRTRCCRSPISCPRASAGTPRPARISCTSSNRTASATRPSVSNKLMVDARMPSRQVIDALKRRNVYVGRPGPCWPTHVRVSLGSREDMRRFKAAFLEVTAAAG